MSSEHRRAEIERLEAGYDGCGCTECQVLYGEIDMSQYAERVIKAAGIITVIAGRTGAGKWAQYHQGESKGVPAVAGRAREKTVTGHQANMNHQENDVTADVIAKVKELASQLQSCRQIERSLKANGISISYRTVARWLKKK